MHVRNFLVIPSILCAAAAFGQTAPKSAHADILNAQGQNVGSAKFKATSGGVKIEVVVSQLADHGRLIRELHRRRFGYADLGAAGMYDTYST